MQSYRPVNLIPNDPNTLVFLANPNPPAQPNAHHGHSQPLPFQHNYYPTNPFQTENRSNHNKSITFASRNPKQECIRVNPNNKPVQGYQFYAATEVTIGNNYGSSNQSSKITEQAKFSYHPSGEQNDRASIGLCLEEAYNPRKAYRRSQSLYKLRYPEMEKQSSGKGYINSYRDVSEYIKANEVPANTSNNYQAKISTPICTDLAPIEQQYPKNKGESPFISLFSKYDETNQNKSNPSDNPKQFNYKPYPDEVKPSASKYSEPLPVRKQSSEYQKYGGYPSSTLINKNGGQIEDKAKRESSKDQFPLKKDYTKTLTTIGKDIEALKNATKQSRQVFEKEIEKNSYLSKLLEKKTSKASEEDVSDWYKSQASGTSKEEKSTNKDQQINEFKQKVEEATKKLQATNRQLQIQIIQLQKELQQKGQELTQKNNEIWDKSKIIIEKNKTIDSISNQLRQCKQKIEKMSVLEAQSKALEEKVESQQAEINERDSKISEMQVSASQILAFLEKEKQQRYKLQRQHSDELSKLNQTISNLNNKIESVENQKVRYSTKVQQLRKILSDSDIEVFQLRSSLIAHQKQIMLLKTQLQSQQQQQAQEKEMVSIAVEAIESEIEEIALAQQQNEVDQSQLSNLDSRQDLQKEQKANLYEIIASYEAREKELAHLLLEGSEHDHERVINRLKQLLEHSKTVEAARAKEQQRIQEHQLYRMHHDYLQKKCQEMNRELKRAGNKLIGVSNEAHQGWKLLNEYNTEIILLNLINLNQKYRQTTQPQFFQEESAAKNEHRGQGENQAISLERKEEEVWELVEEE